MKKSGFTLIELIVVITILAILGTIAFISFKGFSGDTRNAKVTADLSALYNSLNIVKTQDGTVPRPDGALIVTSGGKDISYEGEVGDTVRSLTGADKNMKSPQNTNYKYVTNGTQKQFLLIGEHEAVSNYNTNVFADGTNKVYKGDEVLMLFDSNDNFIGGNVDNSISGLKKAYIGDREISITSEKVDKIPLGIALNMGGHYSTCKEILDNGVSKGNGVYTISTPKGNTEVYCDMMTDGGGWTLIYKNASFGEMNNIALINSGIKEIVHPLGEGDDDTQINSVAYDYFKDKKNIAWRKDSGLFKVADGKRNYINTQFIKTEFTGDATIGKVYGMKPDGESTKCLDLGGKVKVYPNGTYVGQTNYSILIGDSSLGLANPEATDDRCGQASDNIIPNVDSVYYRMNESTYEVKKTSRGVNGYARHLFGYRLDIESGHRDISRCNYACWYNEQYGDTFLWMAREL